MFFYGPALLMEAPTPQVVLAVCSGGLGVLCIAGTVVGFLRATLVLWQRSLLGLAGIALLHQGWMTDLAGLLLMGLVWVSNAQAATHSNTNRGA